VKRRGMRAVASMIVTGIATVAGTTTAQAAPVLSCEASALRASVAGQPAIEPAAIGRGIACATADLTGTSGLPALLDAQQLIARTALDPVTGGSATGGVASLRVLPTPALIAQLPTTQAIDGLPNLKVPVPALLQLSGLPAQVELDVRDAVRALVPAPTEALLSADMLTARAGVACQAGLARLVGSSELTGVKLGGLDVGLDGVVAQALTLIGSRHIDASQLDLSKIQVLTPLTGPLLALLQPVLGSLVAALPPIDLPASVIDARLTPNEQIVDAGTLTQRALRAELSLAGTPLLDAVLGEARAGASPGTCLTAATTPPPAKPGQPAGPDRGGVADQMLACTDRKLVLVDVLRQGSRVKLLGAADRRYAGRKVAIRLRATGRIVARALVREDGAFETTAPAPPRAFLATNKRANRVRYRAEIGKERSLPLKLQRRLLLTSLSSKDGKVTIAGRVVRPLTTPLSTIRVVRRVSCRKVVLVKRFKPRADGTFRITVKAPQGQAAAVYRLATRVREKPSNPRTYPTFTLPRGVALTTR
jgi:hypothetical protein